MKKLYKSKNNRVASGILGGIGEYYNIDPTIVRIGFVILLLATGFFPFGILYIVAYFLIPEAHGTYHVVDEQ